MQVSPYIAAVFKALLLEPRIEAAQDYDNMLKAIGGTPNRPRTLATLREYLRLATSSKRERRRIESECKAWVACCHIYGSDVPSWYRGEYGREIDPDAFRHWTKTFDKIADEIGFVKKGSEWSTEF